jgi:hypothetical protein
MLNIYTTDDDNAWIDIIKTIAKAKNWSLSKTVIYLLKTHREVKK